MNDMQHPSRPDLSEAQRLAALSSRPRSFVDLNAFAADAGQGVTLDASASLDRFESRRRFLDLPAGPVTAGVIALGQDSGAISAQPADEFVIVSEGAIAFTQGERTLTLSAGSSAVIPRGASFSWATQAPASAIFMRYLGGQGTDGAIVPIDGAPQLAPSGAPLAELLLTPTPQCRNQTDYRSPDAQFTCGTWDSTPYHRIAMRYPHYELMHLLEGSVTLVDETGRTATFSRGDIFLVEQGARCSWESLEQVAKVYAIYRPV
ncbi:MAG TPA: cupin domain-containing protein [Trinickia sp.]|nr:cupin domain-containing protein [Trinickia sp.]